MSTTENHPMASSFLDLPNDTSRTVTGQH